MRRFISLLLFLALGGHTGVVESEESRERLPSLLVFFSLNIDGSHVYFGRADSVAQRDTALAILMARFGEKSHHRFPPERV